jgi:hypothetical protein
MFKTLAKSWLAPSRRLAPGPRLAITHCNDNLPGFRRPAAGRRRTPALACHWFDRNGRLECRWHAETDDAPDGGIDDRGTIRAAEARPAGCCMSVTEQCQPITRSFIPCCNCELFAIEFGLLFNPLDGAGFSRDDGFDQERRRRTGPRDGWPHFFGGGRPANLMMQI